MQILKTAVQKSYWLAHSWTQLHLERFHQWFKCRGEDHFVSLIKPSPLYHSEVKSLFRVVNSQDRVWVLHNFQHGHKLLYSFGLFSLSKFVNPERLIKTDFQYTRRVVSGGLYSFFKVIFQLVFSDSLIAPVDMFSSAWVVCGATKRHYGHLLCGVSM